MQQSHAFAEESRGYRRGGNGVVNAEGPEEPRKQENGLSCFGNFTCDRHKQPNKNRLRSAIHL